MGKGGKSWDLRLRVKKKERKKEERRRSFEGKERVRFLKKGRERVLKGGRCLGVKRVRKGGCG